MIDRRGFLGSVIGMVAAYQFRALLPTEPIQIESKIKPYRMAFRNKLTGHVIQAPGIKDFYRDVKGFHFVAEDLECTCTLHVDEVLMLGSKGQVLRSSPFAHGVTACSGDTLKVTYNLDTDLNFTEDEFLKNFERWSENVNKNPQLVQKANPYR